jgi:hypothetical protein
MHSLKIDRQLTHLNPEGEIMHRATLAEFTSTRLEIHSQPHIDTAHRMVAQPDANTIAQVKTRSASR